LKQTRASARRGVGAGGEIGADHACSVRDVGLDGGASALHVVIGELIQKLAVMILRRFETEFPDRQIEQWPNLEPERFDHLEGHWHVRGPIEGEVEFLVLRQIFVGAAAVAPMGRRNRPLRLSSVRLHSEIVVRR